MYHFVFEMMAVKDQLESKDSIDYQAKRKSKKLLKTSVMVTSIIYLISYTTIRTHMAANDDTLTILEEAFYIPTFSIKLVLDSIAIYIFAICLRYFYIQKRSALRKNGARFNYFNYLIISMITLLFILRIIGALYTFAICIISLTDAYKSAFVTEMQFIAGEEIFTIRDFVEVLLFSYLIYFQSKRKHLTLKNYDKYK